MEASFLLPTLLLSLASSPFSAFFFPRLLFVFESNMLEMEEKEKRNGSTYHLGLKRKITGKYPGLCLEVRNC